MRRSLLHLRLLVLTTTTAASNSSSQGLSSCTCGYILNTISSSPSPDRQTIFTSALVTDFTHPSNSSITWTDAPGYDWAVQVYNVSPSASRGPYGKAAEAGNVVLGDDSAESADGERGLELWVRSQLLSLGGEQLGVPMAEIATTRTDVLFGSWRASIKFTAVNGTCGAFFFYRNDSAEIDFEFLSRQLRNLQTFNSSSNSIINLINQSPLALRSGDNAANTPDFHPTPLPFDPTADFHEYRFDWFPDQIAMFVDGQPMAKFTDAVPQDPGAVHLSHWSNGDAGWSAGPPGVDARMIVKWVVGVFNSSLEGEGEEEGGDGGEGEEVDCERCVVPDTGWFTVMAQTVAMTASATTPTRSASSTTMTRVSETATASTAAAASRSGADAWGRRQYGRKEWVLVAICLLLPFCT